MEAASSWKIVKKADFIAFITCVDWSEMASKSLTAFFELE